MGVYCSLVVLENDLKNVANWRERVVGYAKVLMLQGFYRFLDSNFVIKNVH